MKTAYRHAVMGPGRLGSTVIAALTQAGLPVAAVGTRRAPQPAARPPVLPPARAAALADVWWLTVPDDQIAMLAEELAEVAAAHRGGVSAPGDASLSDEAVGEPARGARGGTTGETAEPRLLAVHCSGLGSLSLLDPLASAGADVLCLHPLQSFGGEASAELLQDVPCAVTAARPPVQQLGQELAARIGMRPFPLDDADKPLYHLAAAVACNLFVALESEAGRLLHEATGRDDAAAMLAPILATTLQNLTARGPERALTGPVARGDVATVRAHLALLEAQPPRVAAAYRALSLQALTLAAPRLDDEMVHALQDLLDTGVA